MTQPTTTQTANMATQSPKEENKSEKCSETYWPVLKGLLATGQVTFENLQLPCMVCYEDMTIHPDECCQDGPHKDHSAVVLRCGHIIGSYCMLQSIDSSIVRDASICCPQCRGGFVHKDCLHIHEPHPMPNTMDALNSLSLESSPIKNLCQECFFDDILLCYHMKLRADMELDADIRRYTGVSLTVGDKTYRSWRADKESEEIDTPAWIEKHFRRSIKIPGFFEPENDGYTSAFHEIPDDIVLTCHIVSDVPPATHPPFWDWVQWFCLQGGDESKTAEELHALYAEMSAKVESDM
ncbi:hypothetical protein FHETE_1646 [Fusarium heterosporum]|uniref:RING-type domain-containing protein n=1 Tax=Fusarium heterosporum TaxID=42747 RepID=A0A8H5TY26_FUSHE|nr:hypothetical protein FHETE_1646 [Fusarium heterosporum]